MFYFEVGSKYEYIYMAQELYYDIGNFFVYVQSEENNVIVKTLSITNSE